MKEFAQNIVNQFHNFIDNGGMPVIEYELKDGDFVEVYIAVDDKGVLFELDTLGLKTYFSGDVQDTGGGVYRIKFDEFFTDLDYYLQNIDSEVTEGFLIPNDIMS